MKLIQIYYFLFQLKKIKEPSFGLMSREFMIKDFNDTTIRSYFNLMLYSYQLLHEQLQMFSNRSTDNNKTIHLDENAENDRQSLLPINQRFSSFNREFTFEGEIISPETDVYKQMRDVLKFEQDLAFVCFFRILFQSFLNFTFLIRIH